jgi:hypothetical protein
MRIRDGGSQRDGIEIGIRVTEGMPCGVIEVFWPSKNTMARFGDGSRAIQQAPKSK